MKPITFATFTWTQYQYHLFFCVSSLIYPWFHQRGRNTSLKLDRELCLNPIDNAPPGCDKPLNQPFPATVIQPSGVHRRHRGANEFKAHNQVTGDRSSKHWLDYSPVAWN